MLARRSGLAGGYSATVLGPGAQDQPGLCARRLLHLSDPHFGTEQADAVAALLRLVARRRPALVLLSGDITQRATAAQFERARAFVAQLAPSPVLAIPGNHDIPLWAVWARLLRPYGRYQEALGAPHDREWRNAHCQVLVLNTTRWWRHKHGVLSAQQVDNTAARLRAAPAHLLKLVVTHQPIAPLLPDDDHNLLRGRLPALAAWHAAGVDLVLGGHIHLPYAVPLPVPAHANAAQALQADALGGHAGPGLHSAWAVQAGTAVSSRVRAPAPNSVTELQLPAAAGADNARPPGQCDITFWDWLPGATEFTARLPQALPLRGRPLASRL